jgi:hypothetical protein
MEARDGLPNQDDPCIAKCESGSQPLADDRHPVRALPDSKDGNGAEDASEPKSGWRAFFRVLFGLNAIAFGVIMMLPPLGEPLTAENALIIGVGLVYLFVGWLFIAGHQNKYFKTPF